MVDIKGKVAIIAGRGDLPLNIVQACHALNIPVCVLLLNGYANPADYADVETHTTTVGALGRTLKLLKNTNAQNVVMAGGIDRPSLSTLKPDLMGLWFFVRYAVDSMGDDGALQALSALFVRRGYRVVGANDFLPHAHAVGTLGKHAPTVHDKKSIARGVSVLKTLSPADVAQSIICQNGLVLGIEAIEGTDELINRTTPYVRTDKAGAVLVKMQKHGQSTTADMPTIGVATVENAHRAGLAGIAFDSTGTLLMDRDAMIKRADTLGLFLVAV